MINREQLLLTDYEYEMLVRHSQYTEHDLMNAQLYKALKVLAAEYRGRDNYMGSDDFYAGRAMAMEDVANELEGMINE